MGAGDSGDDDDDDEVMHGRGGSSSPGAERSQAAWSRDDVTCTCAFTFVLKKKKEVKTYFCIVL